LLGDMMEEEALYLLMDIHAQRLRAIFLRKDRMEAFGNHFVLPQMQKRQDLLTPTGGLARIYKG
jgi:hypothetical protein